MTEYSSLWSTNGVGDGQFTYDEARSNIFFQGLFNTSSGQANSGVIYQETGSLDPSGNTTPIAITSGQAVVFGFRYWNNSDIAINIPTPVVGDTGGHIHLYADYAASTIRISFFNNVDGNSAIPVYTQMLGAIWMMPIAEYVIDTNGNIWTDATKTTAGPLDVRGFALMSTSGRIKLRHYTFGGSGTSVFAKIQQDLTALELVISGRSPYTILTTSQVYVEANGGVNSTDVKWDFVNLVEGNVFGNLGDFPAGVVTTALGAPDFQDICHVLISGYNNSINYKPVIAYNTFAGAGTDLTIGISRTSGWFRTANPITALRVYCNNDFVDGSTVDLYGLL